MAAAPSFWEHDGPAARLLAPLGALYNTAGMLRHRLSVPVKVEAKVICVGNATLGGTGKTPIAIDLARRLIARGLETHLLTRGYRGRSHQAPVRVDLARHTPTDVGDEALLLARVAPTWVSPDRAKGARAALAEGAQVLVMDDGLQNPGLRKDFSLLVVDGATGFGNGRVIPAGPLREALPRALARAEAIVIMGSDRAGVRRYVGDARPLLAARLAAAEDAHALRGRRVLAFAGIGRPEKLFEALRELGAEVVGTVAFPDHHVFKDAELRDLEERTRTLSAELVTTEKDAVRLPPWMRERTTVLPVGVAWDDEAALEALLEGVLRG